jgi:phenylacetic acid degradation operon negative regulatory protein
LVAACWELNDVVDGYRQFIACFEPLLALLKRKKTLGAEQAFIIRTLLIHAFRRVELHDPQLPHALLPADWPGVRAYELCRDIYLRTYKEAEDYVSTALQREDDHVPDAVPDFYQRFGGLT